MSNVVNFPVIARPIPVETQKDDPHTMAMKGILMCIKFSRKTCGDAWTEKVLLNQLSLVRASRMLRGNT